MSASTSTWAVHVLPVSVSRPATMNRHRRHPATRASSRVLPPRSTRWCSLHSRSLVAALQGTRRICPSFVRRYGPHARDARERAMRDNPRSSKSFARSMRFQNKAEEKETKKAGGAVRSTRRRCRFIITQVLAPTEGRRSRIPRFARALTAPTTAAHALTLLAKSSTRPHGPVGKTIYDPSTCEPGGNEATADLVSMDCTGRALEQVRCARRVHPAGRRRHDGPRPAPAPSAPAYPLEPKRLQSTVSRRAG